VAQNYHLDRLVDLFLESQRKTGHWTEWVGLHPHDIFKVRELVREYDGTLYIFAAKVIPKGKIGQVEFAALGVQSLYCC
jgi:hypothetical protein